MSNEVSDIRTVPDGPAVKVGASNSIPPALGISAGYDQNMAAEIKKLSPLGRWEKALTRSYGWILFVGILVSSILREPLGFLPSIALTVAVWLPLHS